MDQWEIIVLLVLFAILLVLVVWIFWPGLDDPAVIVTQPADTASIGEICNVTTLCDSGLICETTCRGNSGTKCDGNYQCADELYCVGLVVDDTGTVLKQGTCRTRPTGGLNQPCPTCDPGFICDESISPAICKADEGTECDANDDCYYRVCTSGICTGGQVQADPCTTNFEPFIQGTIVSSSRCGGDLVCDTTDVVTQFGEPGTAGYCQLPSIFNGTDQAFCVAGEPFPQPENMLPPGCNTGLVCLNGLCEVGRQFWGETCNFDTADPDPLATCNPPLVCGVGPGGPVEPVCVYPEFPNTCDLTGDCSIGYQCVDQVCLAESDGFCTMDDQCQTGSCDLTRTKIWRWTGDAKIDPSTTGWSVHSELPTEVVFNTFDASPSTLWGVSLQSTEFLDTLGLKLVADSGNSVSSALGGIYRYTVPVTTLDRPTWEKVFPYQVVETIVISAVTVTRTTTIKNLTAPSDVLIFDGSPLVVANVKLVYTDMTEVQNDALYLLKKLPQTFEEGTIPQSQCFAEALTYGYVLVPFNPTTGDAILGSQHTTIPMMSDEIIEDIVDLDVSEQQDVILQGSAPSAIDFLFLKTDEIINYFLREQGVKIPRFYNSAKGCSEFNYSYSSTVSGSGEFIVFNGVLTGQRLPHPGLTLVTRTYALHDYQHFNIDSHEFVNSQTTLMIAESTNVSTGTEPPQPINLIMVEGLLQSFAPGEINENSRVTATTHGQYLMATGVCSS